MTKLVNTLISPRGTSMGMNSVVKNRQILALQQSPHPDSFPVCGMSLRLKSDGGSSWMAWQGLEIMQEVKWHPPVDHL